MPPPPASLTIVSCKYENHQRLQFTTEFAKTNNNNNNTKKISSVQFYQVSADSVKAKQSKAQQNMGATPQAMPFCPSNKLIFSWSRSSDLESGVRVTCDVNYICTNFSVPRPLRSRVRPDVRDRRTSDRQTERRRQTKTLLNASALWQRRHNKLHNMCLSNPYSCKALKWGYYFVV